MQYSVVNYKTVKENLSFRIDADFFRPVYLEIINKLQSGKYANLKNKDCKVFSGPFGSFLKSESYQEIGHPFIRISDIKDVYIEKDGMVYLDENEFERVKKYQLDVNDIVFSKIGTVGRLSLITEELGKVAISENNIGIKFSAKLDKQERFYIFAFLLSKYGQKQIFRLSSGNVQPKLNVSDIEDLNIPVVSNDFVEKIYQLILSSQSKYRVSKSLYSQAEQLLLSELGLVDWEPKHTLAFVTNYSDTQKAERIDAEYFQPKYEEIIEAVKNYKGGFDELGNLVKIKDKNFAPKENEQYKYIELANISSNGEINGYTENCGNELPSRARRKVQKGDVIVSSIEGSLESIALITEDWKNALCSTGFFAVNSDKINSETLLVLLKTKVGQLQLKKGCKGTILTAISKDELSKIVLPKIESETQDEIKKKIAEMYETKKLSKSLLEIAKRGVEMAIEKDEQEAEKWIGNKLNVLKIDK